MRGPHVGQSAEEATHTRIRRRLLLAARGVCKTSVLRRNGVRRGDWATPHRRASAAHLVDSMFGSGLRMNPESARQSHRARDGAGRLEKKRGGIHGAISRRVRDVLYIIFSLTLSRGGCASCTVVRFARGIGQPPSRCPPCLVFRHSPDRTPARGRREREDRSHVNVSAHGSVRGASLVRSRETAKAPSRPALHQICCCWSW